MYSAHGGGELSSEDWALLSRDPEEQEPYRGAILIQMRMLRSTSQGLEALLQ